MAKLGRGVLLCNPGDQTITLSLTRLSLQMTRQDYTLIDTRASTLTRGILVMLTGLVEL